MGDPIPTVNNLRYDHFGPCQVPLQKVANKAQRSVGNHRKHAKNQRSKNIKLNQVNFYYSIYASLQLEHQEFINGTPPEQHVSNQVHKNGQISAPQLLSGLRRFGLPEPLAQTAAKSATPRTQLIQDQTLLDRGILISLFRKIERQTNLGMKSCILSKA